MWSDKYLEFLTTIMESHNPLSTNVREMSIEKSISENLEYLDNIDESSSRSGERELNLNQCINNPEADTILYKNVQHNSKVLSSDFNNEQLNNVLADIERDDTDEKSVMITQQLDDMIMEENALNNDNVNIFSLSSKNENNFELFGIDDIIFNTDCIHDVTSNITKTDNISNVSISSEDTNNLELHLDVDTMVNSELIKQEHHTEHKDNTGSSDHNNLDNNIEIDACGINHEQGNYSCALDTCNFPSYDSTEYDPELNEQVNYNIANNNIMPTNSELTNNISRENAGEIKHELNEDSKSEIGLIIKDDQFESDSNGYNSSDFEFIDEDEAYLAGPESLTEYTRFNSTDSVDSLDLNKPGPSGINNNTTSSTSSSSSSEEIYNDDDHIIPEGDDLILLFEIRPWYVDSHTEIKNSSPNVMSLNDDNGEYHMDWMNQPVEEVNDADKKAAEETKRKILAMYPNENRKRRRSRSPPRRRY